MIELKRRSFLLGLGSLIAAPAIVRAEWIMPVRKIIMPPAMPTLVLADGVAYWMGYDNNDELAPVAVSLADIGRTRIISAADGVLPWHA